MTPDDIRQHLDRCLRPGPGTDRWRAGGGVEVELRGRGDGAAVSISCVHSDTTPGVRFTDVVTPDQLRLILRYTVELAERGRGSGGRGRGEDCPEPPEQPIR